jgi:hypothetical protein
MGAMKKKAWLRVLMRVGALTVGLGSLGCGGKKEMGEDEFCAGFAKRECDAVVMTCQKTDTAPCLTLRTATCKAFAATAKGGKRAFRPDSAEPCLELVSQTYAKALITPHDLETLDQTCDGAFAGTAKANEACTIDLDCEPSLICDRSRCGPPRAISSGGNCGNPGEVCPDTEYCRQGDGISTCTRRQDKAAACSATIPCLPGLRCEAGACAEKKPNDVACAHDDECQSDYCDPFPPAGMPQTCGLGLSFARFSPSCSAYFGP